MEVRAPLFVVGTGRCGSSALHQVLSRHPQLTWFSQYCGRFPRHPQVNRMMMRLLDSGLPRDFVRARIRPSESWAFWDHHWSGFSEPCRDLVREDVTPRIAQSIRRGLSEMLSPRRDRLMIKITGWPRIGFLKAIFPDARFVHVYRDGRAVACSLMERPWWGGWRGPNAWKWGPLTPDQHDRWIASGQSFAVLAGLEWEILMNAFEHAHQELEPQDWMEIRYDDLCEDRDGSLQRIADFAELAWSPEFQSEVEGFSFVNSDYKWREQLGELEQHRLNEALAGSLQRCGYATA